MRRGLSGLLAGLLVAGLIPAAAFASARVDVGSLAQALQSEPAQVVGAPTFSLSAPEVRVLRRDIKKVDPDRIWVAVVPSLNQKATSRLSDTLSGYLNADGGGTVIVVAGSNVWGSTSWEDRAAATARLAAAFKNPHIQLAQQLRQAVDSFASGDAAAGHPQLTGTSSGTTTSTAAQPSAVVSAGSGGATHRGSGSSAGLIVGLIALGLVLLAALSVGGRRLRATMRASHLHKEERADVQQQAQTDFGKLGDEIGALDIDSSMPNASARGKDEYAKAIDCYQDAERRLRTPDDTYQFERAVVAIKQGREHVQLADQLFNARAEDSAAVSPAHPGPVALARVSGPTPGPGPAPQGAGVVDQLAKLAALHERAELTDTEFEDEKRKLLEN